MSAPVTYPLSHPAHIFEYDNIHRQQFMSALTASFFADRDDPIFVVEGVSSKRRPGYSVLQHIVRCCVRFGDTDEDCFRFNLHTPTDIDNIIGSFVSLQDNILRAPCLSDEFWKNVTCLSFADGSSFQWVVNERGACIGLQDLMFRLVSMSQYRHAKIQRAMDFVVTMLFEYNCVHKADHPFVWYSHSDISRNFVAEFMRLSFCLPHFWVSQCHKFDRTASTCSVTVYFMRQHRDFFTQCRRLLDDFEIDVLPLSTVTLAVESSTIALGEWSLDFQGIFAGTTCVTVERDTSFQSTRFRLFVVSFNCVEKLARLNFPNLSFLNIDDPSPTARRMGSLRKLFRYLVRRDREVTLCSRWTDSASLYFARARAMDTFIRADAKSLAQLAPEQAPDSVKHFFRHGCFERNVVHLIDLFLHGRQATKRFGFATPASELSAINRF